MQLRFFILIYLFTVFSVLRFSSWYKALKAFASVLLWASMIFRVFFLIVVFYITNLKSCEHEGLVVWIPLMYLANKNLDFYQLYFRVLSINQIEKLLPLILPLWSFFAFEYLWIKILSFNWLIISPQICLIISNQTLSSLLNTLIKNSKLFFQSYTSGR
jgi:hypothetical protein